jgi:hypothetical protein
MKQKVLSLEMCCFPTSTVKRFGSHLLSPGLALQFLPGLNCRSFAVASHLKRRW